MPSITHSMCMLVDHAMELIASLVDRARIGTRRRHWLFLAIAVLALSKISLELGNLLYLFNFVEHRHEIIPEPAYLLRRRMSIMEMFDFAWERQCSLWKDGRGEPGCTQLHAAQALGTAAVMGNEGVINDILGGFRLRCAKDIPDCHTSRTRECSTYDRKLVMNGGVRDALLASLTLSWQFPPHEMGCPGNRSIPPDLGRYQGLLHDYPPFDLDCHRNQTLMATASDLLYNLPLFDERRVRRNTTAILELLMRTFASIDFPDQLSLDKGLSSAKLFSTLSQMNTEVPQFSADGLSGRNLRNMQSNSKPGCTCPFTLIADQVSDLLLKYLQMNFKQLLKSSGIGLGSEGRTTKAVLDHLVSSPVGGPMAVLLALPSKDPESPTKLNPEPGSFARNLILEGVNLFDFEIYKAGLHLAEGCAALYGETLTGLRPRLITWYAGPDGWASRYTNESAFEIIDSRYTLDDDVIESFYHAYRFTSNTKYQDAAWRAILAVNATCRAASGFHGVSNVDIAGGGRPISEVPARFFGKTLRYAFLVQAQLCGR